jgi:hypothetical protein
VPSDAEVIEATVADFRSDDLEPPRVDAERWAAQFEPDESPVLLRVVRRWVERYYWPRPKVWDALDALADRLDLASIAVVPSQPRRSGQATLDRLFDLVLRERGVVKRPLSAGAGLHVYLDDLGCTGRTLERHLRPFLSKVTPGSRVVAFHLVEHAHDVRRRREALATLARDRDIDLRFETATRLENRPATLGGLEVLTPTSWSAAGLVPEYRASTRVSKAAFRERDLFGDGPLFADADERDIVERALLRIGSTIALAAEHEPGLRPLGAGESPSLGFGSVAFTFHNAPATMPVALWWRDPRRPDPWFPLVPRRV